MALPLVLGEGTAQELKASCCYHFFVAIPASVGNSNVCEKVVKMSLTCFRDLDENYLSSFCMDGTSRPSENDTKNLCVLSLVGFESKAISSPVETL